MPSGPATDHYFHLERSEVKYFSTFTFSIHFLPHLLLATPQCLGTDQRVLFHLSILQQPKDIFRTTPIGVTEFMQRNAEQINSLHSAPLLLCCFLSLPLTFYKFT